MIRRILVAGRFAETPESTLVSRDVSCELCCSRPHSNKKTFSLLVVELYCKLVKVMLCILLSLHADCNVCFLGILSGSYQ